MRIVACFVQFVCHLFMSYQYNIQEIPIYKKYQYTRNTNIQEIQIYRKRSRNSVANFRDFLEFLKRRSIFLVS